MPLWVQAECAMNKSWRVPRDKRFEPLVACLRFCLCDCVSLSPLEAGMLTVHLQKGDGNFILVMLLIKDLDPITRSVGEAPHSELWCFRCRWKIPLSEWIPFFSYNEDTFSLCVCMLTTTPDFEGIFFPFNFWSNFNYAEEVNADIQNNFI